MLLKVNKLSGLRGKARSAELWKLQGVNPSSLSKAARYSLKGLSSKEVTKIVVNSNTWLKYGIYSAITSSALSWWY